jgi:phosphatidylethanolamine/phosphatidyl-N-methylethanolamine N-methyltransferase
VIADLDRTRLDGCAFCSRGHMHLSDLLYGPLTPFYDVVCGAMLQPGRRRAMSLLDPRAGERILEVGVGTGYGVNSYPTVCRVVAIDLSHAMIVRASRRVDTAHRGMIVFAQMDARHLALPSRYFDAVYVPYTINCVPDPIAVGRELERVCAPQGRIVFLNHFEGVPETSNVLNACAGRMAQAADVNWHLRLDTFVAELNLRVRAVESVNVPRLSSVVLCERSV